MRVRAWRPLHGACGHAGATVALAGLLLSVTLIVVGWNTPAGATGARVEIAGPSMTGSTGSVPEAEFVPQEEFAEPDTWTCDGDVCLEIEGSANTAHEWHTWGWVPSAQCSYASFWQDGSVIATSKTVCSDGAGWLYAKWSNPGTFPSGSSLCNTWASVSGQPCTSPPF